MSYLQYQFTTTPEWRDILLAFLGELPFEVFEETEDGLLAYVPAELADEHLDADIAELQTRFELSWSKQLLPDQNWNEVWESNFQPVIVDDFCGVRAEFHEPLTGVQHELVIQPRMAFGTGHHATTEMMMRQMRDLHFPAPKCSTTAAAPASSLFWRPGSALRTLMQWT
jgi:ribosomal protein L11 methyltransferase